MVVDLKNLISPCFWKTHNSMDRGDYFEYWIKGGRHSTKSSFWALEIVFRVITEKDANAIVLRRYQSTIKKSIYNNIKWAINILGVEGLFQINKTDKTFTVINHKNAGQVIICCGLDDPDDHKSIKAVKGYFKYCVFEEFNQFRGMEQIKNFQKSVLRGGDKFINIFCYNPPKSDRHWVNIESKKAKPDRVYHHSTYLDIPQIWLNRVLLDQIEYDKENYYQNYLNEYLGQVTGVEGAIFTNVENLSLINSDQIPEFWNIRQGIDWGFALDPFCYIKAHLHTKRRTLYIYDEIYQTNLLNKPAIELVKQKKAGNKLIIADNEEPKSIKEFKNAGINIKASKKGKGSVAFGIKFLQDFDKIYISEFDCPNTFNEFINYSYIRHKDGSFINDYPDKNNHSIDSTRYALENDMNSDKYSQFLQSIK